MAARRTSRRRKSNREEAADDESVTASGVDEPRLELVGTTPMEPSPSEGLFNALSNPGAYVSMSMQAKAYVSPESKDEVPWPESFLFNLKATLDSTWQYMGVVSAEWGRLGCADIGWSERVRARVLLQDLGHWLMMALIMRRRVLQPGESVAPLVIPTAVREQLQELARLGATLSAHRIELETSGRLRGNSPVASETLASQTSQVPANVGGTGTNRSSAPEQDLPPVQLEGGAWVSTKAAAKALSVSEATLANLRSQGKRSNDGIYTTDKFGRISVKHNRKVLYLKSSLRDARDKGPDE